MHRPLGQPPVGQKPDEPTVTDIGIDGVSMNQPGACACKQRLAVPNDLVDPESGRHPDCLLAATAFQMNVVTIQ